MAHKQHFTIATVSGLLCLIMVLCTWADQVIYVKVSDFDPDLSDFNVDVAGNKWVERDEEGSLFGTAFGAPGDNNRDVAGPHLVIKLPKPVEANEAGKTWVAWARMMHPEALVTGNLKNSTFFRMSPDAKRWTPPARGSADLVWNDPGGANHSLFPAMVNEVDVFFTDVGDELPWFWQNHKATINAPRAPDSTIDPPMEAGDNYIELVPRESDPVDYPRIEIICLRNDGNPPSDAEALELFSVEPLGKLALTWGQLKVGR